MHCCTANASRTLYYIWDSILDCQDKTLRVNLLLNRASRWAEFNSYLPYQGKVELKVKQQLDTVSVRMPTWIETDGHQILCAVNGQSRAISWQGRYVNVGAAAAGDTVSLSFPIREQTIRKRIYGEPHETMIGAVEYNELVFRGNTLVSIDPPGGHCPIYQRNQYRSPEPAWRKMTRFVAEQE